MIQNQMPLCELCSDIPYDHVINQLFETYGYANLRSKLDELLEDQSSGKG